MNEHAAFERYVADRFAEVQPVPPPDHHVDDILARARRTRPLPRWLATLREPPMRASSRVTVGSPMARTAWLVMLVLALSLLTSAGLAVGATLLTEPPPSVPRSIIVAPDGSGDFRTIGEAVEHARDGDTVRVRPGTYRESVRITRRITLVGDGPPATVVIVVPTGGPTVRTMDGSLVTYGVALEGSHARVANLTIRGIEGAGVWVTGGAPMLEGLTVSLANYGFDFEFRDGTTATLRDSSGSWMTVISTGASPTIERLIEQGGGFISGPGTDPVIRDSRFGYALDVDSGAEPIIERNHLLGLKLMHRGTPVIRDNVITNPAFVAGGDHRSSEEVTAIEIIGGTPLIERNRISAHEVGISIDPDSRPTIEGNRIEANTTGVLFLDVPTSGPSAATTDLPLDVSRANTFCGNGIDISIASSEPVTLPRDPGCDQTMPGAISRGSSGQVPDDPERPPVAPASFACGSVCPEPCIRWPPSSPCESAEVAPTAPAVPPGRTSMRRARS